MSKETAKQAIDFYYNTYCKSLNGLGSDRVKKIVKIAAPTLSWWGGEPFLNFELIKWTKEYFESLNWDLFNIKQDDLVFSIVTNFTIVNNDILNFLIDNKVYTFISLDGNKKANDTNRKFPSGRGSYVCIQSVKADNINHLLSKRFIQKNLSSKVLKCMSYEQSHWGKESSLNNKKEVDSKSYKNIEKGSKEYIHFFDEISLYSYKDLSKLLDKNRDFYDFFESLIYYDENLSFDNPKGNNIQCKKFSCPIGVDAIFVDTGGQLHMCNKSDYSYPIGNVIDGFSKEKLANLYERYYKEVRANCLECWAFNYCKICPATIMISNNMNIKNRDICILSQNALSNMLIALIILSSYENLYENIIKFFRLQKKEESFLTFKVPVYKYDY